VLSTSAATSRGGFASSDFFDHLEATVSAIPTPGGGLGANPEPSTLTLFGLGFLALLGYAWQRRQGGGASLA
jgi:hypothetical protein